MPSDSLVLTPARVRSARNAVAAVFAAAGIAFASLAARFPAVRADLHLSPADLGTLLLCMSLGSVGALPLSGPLVHRLGPGRTVALGFTGVITGLATIGLGDDRLWLGIGFAFMGIGSGVSDVAMNVEAADVERRLGRDIMSRFHAGFSVGTVAGAAGGSAMAHLGVGYRPHLFTVALLVAVIVVWGLPRFVHGFSGREADHHPTVRPDSPEGERTRRRGAGQLAAWKEPRTLLIGVLVLGMAFSEGSASDWIGQALVDDYGTGQSLAAAGYGVFVTAMTVARFAGPWLLARLGRVSALRGGAALVLVGSSLIVWGTGAPEGVAVALAMIGALLWGAGAALGFPVGMSAAADDPRRAAARVSVVSTIGYTAFIAGPPALGHLGDRIGVARALVVVSVAVVLSLLAASAAAPLAAPPSRDGEAPGEGGHGEPAAVDGDPLAVARRGPGRGERLGEPAG